MLSTTRGKIGPKMKRIAHLVACVAAFLGSAASVPGTASAAKSEATVSVMTYNVHGLPWPIADDRSASLSAIAKQLRDMRSAGHQPDLVALQEAFVPDAKAIGAAAGYRYVAFGAPAEASAAVETSADRLFRSAGSVLHGEGIGKHVGSGLAIFSDYPILAVRRISYPVCAGYDCLANKGAMAAEIAIPGVAGKVTVIDTHLNSNRATGVSEPRALYAYKRQIDLLSAFILSITRAGKTALVAGDFNVGQDPNRREYFAQHILGRSLALTPGSLACRTTPDCHVTEPADVMLSTRRAKDWLMYHSSSAILVHPRVLSAPFGHSGSSAMLSDHVGVVIAYELDGHGSRRRSPRLPT